MIRRASWVPQVAMLWQFGDTALHWAVMGGTRNHDLIVKKLVSEHADVTSVSKKEFTVCCGFRCRPLTCFPRTTTHPCT